MPEAEKLAREYELVYILRPTVGAFEARKVADRVSDIVQQHGAKLTRVDNWGKRKLAYPIQKHTRGVFVLVKFVGFSDIVSELERNLKILDDVMRWQTVRVEDEVQDFASLEVDPEDVQFRDVETTEDEDDEPSFEERLGMRSRERAGEGEEDESEGETESAVSDLEEGDDSADSASDDSDDDKNEGE